MKLFNFINSIKQQVPQEKENIELARRHIDDSYVIRTSEQYSFNSFRSK